MSFRSKFAHFWSHFKEILQGVLSQLKNETAQLSSLPFYLLVKSKTHKRLHFRVEIFIFAKRLKLP